LEHSYSICELDIIFIFHNLMPIIDFHVSLIFIKSE